MNASLPLLRTEISPNSGRLIERLRDVWQHRELVFFLAWRDVKLRYKQTALGAGWAVLQPLAMMAVFWLFFGAFAGVPSSRAPYPVFALVGLVPWVFFAQGVSQAANSLVNNANLIGKVYFPRLALPLAAVLAGLIDMAVATPVLLCTVAFAHHSPGSSLALLPLCLVLLLVVTMGTGVWLAAVNAEYRDVRHTLPFLIQIWLFATPVIYPGSLVASRLEAAGLPIWLYGLNPMAGVVEGFRSALLGGGDLGPMLAASFAVATALLALGLLYFTRTEKKLADVL